MKYIRFFIQIQFWSVTYTLVARICKNSSKTSHSSSVAQGESSRQQVLKSVERFKLSFTANFTFNTTKHCFSTLLSVLLQLFVQNESHG